MREAQLERKCCKWAKDNGWLVYKFVSPNQSGVPDRVFIKSGRIVFVEFKAQGEQLRPLQQKIINTMIAHGATVYTVDSFEGFLNVIA